MKPITHPLAIVYMEAARDYVLTEDRAALSHRDAAGHAWREAGAPLYADPPAKVRYQCCYINLEGARCEDVDEFGGFCSTHDTEIHDAGGDNSPGGSAIIRRSALDGVNRG